MSQSFGLSPTRKFYDEMWELIHNSYHKTAKIFLDKNWLQIYDEYLKKYVLNNHTYQTSILYLEYSKIEKIW